MACFSTLIGGIVFLLIGWVFLYTRIQLFRTGVITTATVSFLEERNDTESDATYYQPSFKYTVQNNVELIYQSQFLVSEGELVIGQEVKLIYNPALPWEARLVNSRDLFTSAFILITIGAAIIVLACCCYLGPYLFSGVEKELLAMPVLLSALGQTPAVRTIKKPSPCNGKAIHSP